MAKAKKTTNKQKVENAAGAGFYGGAGASVVKAGKGNPVKGVKKKAASYGTKLDKAVSSAVPEADAAHRSKSIRKAGKYTKKAAKYNARADNNIKWGNASANVAKKNYGINTPGHKRVVKRATASAKRSVKSATKNTGKAGVATQKANAALASQNKTSGARYFATGAKKGAGVVLKSKTYRSGYKGAIAAGAAEGAYIMYKRRSKSGKVSNVRRRRSK